MKATLYTTHCPLCFVIQSKLSSKNIDFTEVTDVEKIKKVSPDGSVPILEVDGKYMVFKEALEWINGVNTN